MTKPHATDNAFTTTHYGTRLEKERGSRQKVLEHVKQGHDIIKKSTIESNRLGSASTWHKNCIFRAVLRRKFQTAIVGDIVELQSSFPIRTLAARRKWRLKMVAPLTIPAVICSIDLDPGHQDATKTVEEFSSLIPETI